MASPGRRAATVALPMALPISFLSDFGLEDEFVGVCHGVLARVSPESRVIDVGHGFGPGNVKAGALALLRAIQYLPEGVCLAVIDPGVGTERRALAVETPWGYFVGPDNGLLSPAVAMTGGASRIVSIENPDVRIPSPGQTFHGRDVFAPAAGLLASGESDLSGFGPEVGGDEVMPLLLPLTESDDTAVTGEAWWVDRFGNVETNVSPDDLASIGVSPGATVTMRIGAGVYNLRWVAAYGEVEEGEPLLHVDSAGLVAIAVRGGRADEQFDLAEGVSVTLAGRR